MFLLAALACTPKVAETTPPAEPPAEAPAAPDAADAGMSPAQPGLLTEAEFQAMHQLKEGEAPKLYGEVVSIGGGETAYLSLPEGEAPFPAVLVIHEWWGLNDNIKHWADRLAADGYAALAVDLYSGAVATTSEEAMAAMKQVDEEAAAATLAAAHGFLVNDERVRAPATASVGWCFGGGWSLRHAIANPELDAAIIYYGRLTDDAAAIAAIQAPLLGHFGERDKGIPVASVRAFEATVKAADKVITVHTYDADHAFANPSNAHYDHAAAGEAWARSQAFLAEHLKAP